MPAKLNKSTLDLEKTPKDDMLADPVSIVEDDRSHHSNNDHVGLPPQDTGKGAWLFLFGACIIEIAAWGMYCVYCPVDEADLCIGFPYCYGVFESYFVSNPPFEGMSIVSVGGVLSNVCAPVSDLFSV